VNEEQRIAFLEASLARLLQWIGAAEARITVILGIDTAMLGTLAAFAPSPKLWTTAAVVCGAIAVFSLVLSLIFVALASFPRTTGPKQSIIYFDGITSRDSDQYLALVRSVTTGEYIEDLVRQCHRNAQIASAKFEWVRRGFLGLFIAIMPWALAIFLLYQQRP
jgi:hypothetical protein